MPAAPSVIWKFPVRMSVFADGCVSVSMPGGAKLLSAQLQKGDLTVWAIVDAEKATQERRLRVVMTGEEVEPTGLGVFFATVQLANGIVVHLFDQGER